MEKEKMYELFLQCCKNRPYDLQSCGDNYQDSSCEYDELHTTMTNVQSELNKLKDDYMAGLTGLDAKEDFELKSYPNCSTGSLVSKFNFSEQPPLVLVIEHIYISCRIDPVYKIIKSFSVIPPFCSKDNKNVTNYKRFALFGYTLDKNKWSVAPTTISTTSTVFSLHFGELKCRITKEEYDNAMTILKDSKKEAALKQLDKRLDEFNK